jgi:hypothetical protein
MLKDEICNLLQDSSNINVFIFRGIITNLINDNYNKREKKKLIIYLCIRITIQICVLKLVPHRGV